LIKTPKGRSVLLACLGEELHDIGLRCTGYIFEAEGWRVHYLGARTPKTALLATMKKTSPEVVAISLSFTVNRESVMGDLRDVSTSAREIGADLTVGGRAASAARDESVVPDEILTSSRDVLEYIRRLEKGNGAGPAEREAKNARLEQ
jgi:methylmalonyl-CoA mutase cobalamin-binding subunit